MNYVLFLILKFRISVFSFLIRTNDGYDNDNDNNNNDNNDNLREFGCKLPSSLPSCVREGRSGSGVGVARHVGIWRPSRSIVFFGD